MKSKCFTQELKPYAMNLKHGVGAGNKWSQGDRALNYLENEVLELRKHMKNMLDIQGSKGNLDHDRYMHGMYNGMELIFATLEDREPIYREAPENWLCDKESVDNKATIPQN